MEITHSDGQAIDQSLYLALFRLVSIADLEGPAKAVEWAQSVLDDDRLRAAFTGRGAPQAELCARPAERTYDS
jgi:predicted RNA polymerase sigma factor